MKFVVPGFLLAGCTITPEQQERIVEVATETSSLLSQYVPGGGIISDVISLGVLAFVGKKGFDKVKASEKGKLFGKK